MDTDSRNKNFLESQIRELYCRVVWTHKTQEKCADIIIKKHSRLKIMQIILSALTTTGILVTIFGKKPIIGIISAALSAVLFGLSMYSKDYDLGEIAQKHIHAASDIWNIRESYLSLLTDIKIGKLKLEEIIAKRDSLQKDLYEIYKGAPRTINSAYREATKGLKQNEEITFTNEEINDLLPESFRN